MSIHTIVVRGIPRPGGGKIGGYNKQTGKTFVRPDNPRTKFWRQDVVAAAAAQYKGPLLLGPVRMQYIFVFPRPKSHYGTGKNADKLKVNAPYWHTTKPDLTKIIRSTEDALTGIVYKDDSQVCDRDERKIYLTSLNDKPGVVISIEELP
ncbi:MAG: RusA family crossover junction endodeoxyribonuclease [Cyanobacteria bacterium HKST-UBA01]|nr:RusA family crossover junction endodeoxyribonuclease [Cyanobacteria bacterium HKST-UBA01]